MPWLGVEPTTMFQPTEPPTGAESKCIWCRPTAFFVFLEQLTIRSKWILQIHQGGRSQNDNSGLHSSLLSLIIQEWTAYLSCTLLTFGPLLIFRKWKGSGKIQCTAYQLENKLRGKSGEMYQGVLPGSQMTHPLSASALTSATGKATFGKQLTVSSSERLASQRRQKKTHTQTRRMYY